MFFLMSLTLCNKVETEIRRWVKNGSFFKLIHLSSPSRAAGISQPLQNIVHNNLASILAECSPAELQEQKSPPTSLSISQHISHAAYLFHKRTSLPPPAHTTAKYLRIPLHARDSTATEALRTKIQAKGNDNSEIDFEGATILTDRILLNSNSLPADLSPKLRYHAFRMIHNALPTARRLSQYHPCPACSEHRDDANHFYSHCTTVRRAARMIDRKFSPTMPDTSVLITAGWDDYRFREPRTPTQMKILLAFSLAAWLSRGQQNRLSFANCAVNLFQSLHKSMSPKPRKQRDRAAEREEFGRYYRGLDPFASRAFTDGSSLGSGAGGAGFVSLLGDGKTRYHSCSLGLASNNAAEISALRLLFESTADLLLQHPSIPRRPLLTFTDNKYAIMSVDGNVKNRTNRIIIRDARAALRRLRAIIPVTLGWVPGHAGVALNEVSDALAKRGAHGTTSDLPPAPDPPQQVAHKPSQRGVSNAANQPTSAQRQDPKQDLGDPQPARSLRPRKRVCYRQSGPWKQNSSSIDFSMVPPKRKPPRQPSPQSSEGLHKRPKMTPLSLPSPPKGRSLSRGLGRFGYSTPPVPLFSSSSSSASSSSTLSSSPPSPPSHPP